MCFRLEAVSMRDKIARRKECLPLQAEEVYCLLQTCLLLLLDVNRGNWRKLCCKGDASERRDERTEKGNWTANVYLQDALQSTVGIIRSLQKREEEYESICDQSEEMSWLFV
jgi:hypothetical protein